MTDVMRAFWLRFLLPALVIWALCGVAIYANMPTMVAWP